MDTIETKTNIEAESEGLLSQKQMNRRTFIKKSAIAGLTGLAGGGGGGGGFFCFTGKFVLRNQPPPTGRTQL